MLSSINQFNVYWTQSVCHVWLSITQIFDPLHTHHKNRHKHKQWAVGWSWELRARSRGSQTTSVNAHTNDSLPSLASTTFLSPLYLSLHPTPTCLAHSTLPFHFFFLSTPHIPSFHLCCQDASHSTCKEQANPSCGPQNSACWILQLWSFLLRETGRITNRQADTDRQKQQVCSIRTQKPRSTKAMLETKHFVFSQPLLCVCECVWVCA